MNLFSLYKQPRFKTFSDFRSVLLGHLQEYCGSWTIAKKIKVFTMFYEMVTRCNYDEAEMLSLVTHICNNNFILYGRFEPTLSLIGSADRRGVEPSQLRCDLARNKLIWLMRASRILLCLMQSDVWRRMPVEIVTRIIEYSLTGAFNDKNQYNGYIVSDRFYELNADAIQQKCASSSQFFSKQHLAIRYLVLLARNRTDLNRITIGKGDVDDALEIWIASESKKRQKTKE